MRIRVVAGEIVHSPVAESGSASAPGGFGPVGNTGVVDLTTPASSDERMAVDRAGSRSGSASLESTPIEDYGELSSSFEQVPYKGKKRGRKPKGSNASGSRAMTKISSRRLELEDDEWDREDFFKIPNKGAQSLKRRRGWIECNLDDRLSSGQKTAVEEVTGLFPQMSPKSVVAETLRVLDIAGEAERRTQTMNGALRRQIKVGVNVAKIVVQRLVSDIAKNTGPQDVSSWWISRGSPRTIVVIGEWARVPCVGECAVPPSLSGVGSTRRDITGSGVSKTARVSYAAVAGGISGSRKDADVSRPTVRGPRVVPSRPVTKESRFRAPKTAAVLLRCAETEDNSGPSYADVVRLARGKISLEELNITNPRIRKAQAGGLLIEIPGGEEAGAKAEVLVDRLKAVLAESDFKDRVSVVRPVRRAEIRLTDVDQSVSAEEVIKAVATIGEVPTPDIRTGPFRPGPKRRLQCFRCLAVGHTRVNCQSVVDRSTWCFQCGENDGHRAAGCRLPPHCPVCAVRDQRQPVETLAGPNRQGEEFNLGLVAVSEPNRVPEDDHWLASTDVPASAAITWQWSCSRVPCSPRWRGTRFAAVDWGDMIMVSCYFPLSLSNSEFLYDLRELETKVQEVRGRPIIVLGDFNARAPTWDPGQPNRRGRLLMDWLGLLDLHLLNSASEPTCVHPRGVSWVDLTLASSSAARRITSWRVGSGVESLSDHRYVFTEIDASLTGPTTGGTALKAFPRWAIGRMDPDLMEAAAAFSAWSGTPEDAVLGAEHMNQILRDISDVSMPRRGLSRRPTTYWWNQEIADLRRNCNACRRRLMRARAKRSTSRESLRGLWDALREARRSLRRAIVRSKMKLRAELVDDLDRDSWGMPYRVILKKLRAGGASIVGVLPSEIVGDIVGTLFPTDCSSRDTDVSLVWRDDLAVTVEEVLEAGRNIKSGKAPEPDDVAGVVVKDTMKHLAPSLHAFLDATGGVADGQYGFRQYRSTIDAIWDLRERVDEGLRDGGVVVAVSLDIANAFNFLPWPVIGEALVGYDTILRLRLPIGCLVICYADDTLMVACADSFKEARVRAEVGATFVIRSIERLGLRVSVAKTEAAVFSAKGVPAGSTIRVGGVVVSIGSAVKYLGLTLDSRWTFRDHFRLLLPKAWGMAMALARLTANIGGPGERRRHLYATVVMSVVLYGTPIWAQTVSSDRGILWDVRRLQRQLALRIMRGYRTVSHESAAILSEMVPFDIIADRLRRSYLQRRMIIVRDGGIAPQVSLILAEMERRRSVSKWREFCRAAVDTAAHTLLFCPAWAEQRSELLEIVGVDRTFRAVVRAIVRSPKAFSVFADFCETVMRRKKEDERARERGLGPPGDALVSPPNLHRSDEEL
ncbi:PO11 protein, partial [Pseudoatta argentina]